MVDLLSPAQVRAARQLLGWKQDDLAAHSSVSASTIRRFEIALEDQKMREPYDAAIRRAFEAAGVIFLAEGEIVSGVALKNGVAQRMKGKRK